MATAIKSLRGTSKSKSIPTTRTKAVAAVVSASLASASLPAFAAQTIHCSSSGYRYTYCPVDTDNEVRIERQRSSSECQQG